MLRFSGVFLLFLVGVLLSAQEGAPTHFKNPILPGFHPDPSIIRVGEDYYLVNSSFEWYPGLPIYHSKDLVNWKLIGYGVHRPEQVEIPANTKDSRALYAPTLRYHEGTYYLINTCVTCGGNFYLTAKDPAGPWSDPIWLDSRGIDPSLFWEDGKCYYQGHANISGEPMWPDKNGVWMQELDLATGKLVGPKKQLTHGHATNARWTEGPHLYKINGKYVLTVAEGGTGFQHAVTAFHSDSLWGPYLPYHSNPLLTHRHLGKDYPIHSTGHADLVQTQNGEWWAVTLGKRLYQGKTPLARETFLTPVEIQNEEGYPLPVFNPGHGKLLLEQERPNLPWSPHPAEPVVDDFTAQQLALHWNFLRTPYTKWYTLAEGKLNVALRPEMADSLHNPSLIARRIQHHTFTATVAMRFQPEKTNEAAGLIIYRNSGNHYQLLREGKEMVLYKSLKGNKQAIARRSYPGGEVVLQAAARDGRIQFSCGPASQSLQPLGEAQDLMLISDDVSLGFNGPYVGMYATSQGQPSQAIASYDWFAYAGE
ncbi:glycoside hydrolase family 43 protein [Neolewinella lacunae]|uniref:Glycoside hydrolase family 43 protein n=1 Tax=Neolewinella lacunae TaxID=1517758 RepID=A0A923PPK5_9BACT|nr:glycoside hydrolase family 43 protein [Neolewinella lacunae]MBC6995073.1 glycoside hydrolase family 43 protein [Neolewinella lacunae]MDN3635378.1 glycoside hydrolase family 43 protein [Neolewinella lacunae]